MSSFTSIIPPALVVAISGIAFLAVLVLIIFKCTDCYNSEVSSENHPACAEKQPKWGGAVGYTSANYSGMNSGFQTGERVELNEQQSLPYAMIPHGVPESAGFQGYSTGVTERENSYQNQPSQVSYSEGDSLMQGNLNSRHGGARNYNPVEPEEPPPAYHDTVTHGQSGNNF